MSADDKAPAVPADYVLDPSRPPASQEALLRLMGGVELGADTGTAGGWSRSWRNEWGVDENFRGAFRQMVGRSSQTPAPTEWLEIPDLKMDPRLGGFPKLGDLDYPNLRREGWRAVANAIPPVPLDAPTVSTPLEDLAELRRQSQTWGESFSGYVSQQAYLALEDIMRRVSEEAVASRLRHLAEYRLATGPLAPFLRAALADPADPLPRMLLGDVMAENGHDRRVRRSPEGADLMTSDCLQTAAGRWSVRAGVLCWHGKGLPLARVARLRPDEDELARLGERSELADATRCQSCGAFEGRIDYGPCPCRGLVAPPLEVPGASPTCSCPPGRPGPRWLCRPCQSQKHLDFLYARQFASAGPERLARLRTQYRREDDLRYGDRVEETLRRIIGHTETATE